MYSVVLWKPSRRIDVVVSPSSTTIGAWLQKNNMYSKTNCYASFKAQSRLVNFLVVVCLFFSSVLCLVSVLNFPSLRNVNSCRKGRVLRCWIITGFKILLAVAIFRDICLQWVIKLWHTFRHISKTRCDILPVILEEVLQVLSSMQIYYIT